MVLILLHKYLFASSTSALLHISGQFHNEQERITAGSLHFSMETFCCSFPTSSFSTFLFVETLFLKFIKSLVDFNKSLSIAIS